MSKVILEGHIIVPEADLALVMRELPVHIRNTREEDGCLVFRVSQDENLTNKFHVYEEFRDKVAFTLHQERVQSSRWGEVAANVQRYYRIR
ncbi:putative quinol monooxygenase [Sansalvadorimonas verongulae]|uniref:putative quinol monooxygenase n=1 Tax=Sansalvadorimonas verongulae TaxID=2172824 RepID=UPI0012BD0D89|nr:antibiotic biosynthesis monooxygenase [Sansalvadorimonas verongulae]MTI13858.1 antibiotic biosynthesis monooxygenase [Sansalvadorimonas verongulae]